MSCVIGEAWQFDKRVIHDGFSNKYSFIHNGKNFNLVPLTPKQVYEDQLQLQQSFEKQRGSEKLRENESAKERGKAKEKKIENPKEAERQAGKSETTKPKGGRL